MALVSPVEQVAAGLWRLPLASRTLPPFDHTNAYLAAGGGEAVLIDPGADDPAALASIGAALGRAGASLKAVLLTHTHPDHVAGLRAVGATFGAPPVMVHPLEQERLPAAGLPLLPVAPFRAGGLELLPLFTPGHSPGHLSFHLPALGAALVGDLLAGEGTTWVGLPEGDMRAYLASLDQLAALPLAVAGPGHGPLLRAPRAKALEVKAHRLAREEQLLALLRAGPKTAPALRKTIYPALLSGLGEMAERTLEAHLDKLIGEGRLYQEGARYRLAKEVS